MKYPNDMEALNEVVKPCKWGIIALSITSLILSGLLIYSEFKPPIVVLEKESHKYFLSGIRKQTPATEESLKAFLKGFVMARYNWEKFNKETILRNISPMATKGLLRKIDRNLEANANIKQTAAAVKIFMDKKGAWVTFYLIVEIKEVPFIVKKKLFVQLIRGSRTKWNPMGVYMDKMIVYGGSEK